MNNKLFSIAASFMVGAFIFATAGLAPLYGGAAFGIATGVKMLVAKPIAGIAMNALDVSGISGFAEANKKELIATMVNGLDIVNDIMLQPNVKNKIKLPKLTIGNGFRPFSSSTDFGLGGDIKFTERELETRSGKRELLIDVRVMKDKYLAWRTNAGNGASKKFDDYEFAKFVWQQVIKGVQREINDETAYFGFDKSTATAYNAGNVYAANAVITFTPAAVGRVEYFKNISGSATTAGQSPDTHPAKWRNVTARAVAPGFELLINALITGGFAPTSTGAITSGTLALDAFKELFRDMPKPYQQSGVIIHCSYTDGDFLKDGIETNLSKYTTPDVSDMIKQGLIPIPGSNYKGWAKPVTWLGNSRRLIASPMMGTKSENLYIGTDLLSDMNDIKTKENLWTVEAGIACDLGFQIADIDALRLGDQA